MKKNKTIILYTIILSAALVIAASCRNTKINTDTGMSGKDWQIIGPGAGGGVFLPTISPFDTNLVFSKGDMTGNFVTNDGGKNWKLFNLMSVATDFEFDPSDPDVVYTSSRGYLYDEDRGSGLSMLYRSENRGETWQVIYPDIADIEPIEKLQSMSFLPSELISGLPDGSIDMIKVDPYDNMKIYLGLSPLKPYIGRLPEETPKMIFLMGTENRGKEWKLISRVPGTEVLGIFTPGSGFNEYELVVITEETCMRVNTKTGKTEELQHPEGRIVRAESGTDGDKRILYLITTVQRNQANGITGGLFRSTDFGASWKQANGDIEKYLPAGKQTSFVCMDVCESKPEVVYLSAYTPVGGPDAITASRYEIYKSINSGVNWRQVYSANAEEVLSKNFNDSWLNQKYGPGWGGYILTLGISPTNPDICYATDFGQAYKTSDGGTTWNQVCSTNCPDGSVKSTGLDLTCCYGIVFDPFDKNHLIVSYIDIGVFHSFDGGKTWNHHVNGIPDKWVNTCYDIAFDPDVKGRVWSTWANKHSLPRQSQFGDGLFKSYEGGVAFSEDGGRTWEKSNQGIPEGAICTDLLLDPESPENNRILYLSTFNQGIYKSVDGGKSWISTADGLKDNRYAWELRFAGKRIYLLCVRGWRGEEVIDGMLYYSDNQATTWQEASMPDGVTAPSDLLIDPDDQNRMYLSCWPKHVNRSDSNGGVYVTRDGGRSWESCFDERIRVFAGAFDPANSMTLYINTFQNGAYKSDDSGKSWKRISGYRFKWGHCPIPDPHNPGMLYLTTYGVSIYYGSANSTTEEYGKIENIPDTWW